MFHQYKEPIITIRQIPNLLVTIFIIAYCGISYELIIGGISTYLLGDSIYQFSITIGLFMFSMGLGSFLTKYLKNNLLELFILVEMILSIVGAVSGIALFVVYAQFYFAYKPVLYLFIIIIGALVGFEIPVLVRIMNTQEKVKESIANVLSIDYLGALFGAIAFPIILLPNLGLIRSALLIGLLNQVVAFVNLITFKTKCRNYKTLFLMSITGVILLLSGLIVGANLTMYAEGLLYSDQVILKKQTKYQEIVLTKNIINDRHKLFIDGHLQFNEIDEYRYHESLVHPVMSLPDCKDSVLIIGGGDGLALRELLKYESVISVDLVDIDPKILEIAKKTHIFSSINQSSLSHEKVNAIAMDAYKFLEKVNHTKYDVILIDLPDPHNESLSKLYSLQFYKMILHSMKPGGVFATQGTSPFKTRISYWTIDNTINAAGFNTVNYHIAIPSFGIWGFHIGSIKQINFSDISIKKTNLRFITSDIFQSSMNFADDIKKIPTQINSMMEPHLFITYQNEIKN